MYLEKTSEDQQAAEAVVLQEDDFDFDTADMSDEIHTTEALSGEIDHLITLATAIETYGISPGLMQIADREGLLASTFISIPSTESMSGPYRPDSLTSIAAYEGVIGAIASKIGQWAAKAGSLVKAVAGKLTGMIGGAIGGVGALAAWAGRSVWNAAKATGAAIKAHPYRTILLVIAAIAAVASSLALVWAFPAEAAQVGAWFNRIRAAATAIKMPGGAVVTKIPQIAAAGANESGAVATVQWIKASETAAEASQKLSSMGWTKNAVGQVVGSLKAALGKIRDVIRLIHMPARMAATVAENNVAKGTSAALKAVRIGPKTTAAVSKFAGRISFKIILRFAIKFTWVVVSKVVFGGIMFVKKTVVKIVNAVSGKTAESEFAEPTTEA